MSPYSLQDLINSATKETNTSEEWATIISICERAGRNEASAREAIEYLKPKIWNTNPNVVLFALTVSNSLVQNCDVTVHREIASRSFCDTLMKQVANKNVHDAVRSRILGFIQQWAELFSKNPSLGIMNETYNSLRNQNYRFPGPPIPDPPKASNSNRDKEEEELQLALALSASALEDSKKIQKTQSRTTTTNSNDPKALYQVRAMYDFQASVEGELSLKLSDVVNVYDCTSFGEWWLGKHTVNGTQGIFPSNYVEKLATVNVSNAAKNVAPESEYEVLLRDSKKVEELVHLFSSMDPQRDNITENERVQTLYHDAIVMRPRLINALESSRKDQDELMQLSDRFANACSVYHKLMEASMAQYRLGPSNRPGPGYGSQEAQPYVGPPNHHHQTMSQPPAPSESQRSYDYAPSGQYYGQAPYMQPRAASPPGANNAPPYGQDRPINPQDPYYQAYQNQQQYYGSVPPQ